MLSRGMLEAKVPAWQANRNSAAQAACSSIHPWPLELIYAIKKVLLQSPIGPCFDVFVVAACLSKALPKESPTSLFANFELFFAQTDFCFCEPKYSAAHITLFG